MKTSTKIGLGFGITSGVITTLGLMIGLYSGTNSRLAILGGIITIAIADAFSDSLGIHISEETTKKSHKKVWQSTSSTFLAKFFTAAIFILPIIFIELKNAIILNIIIGITILIIFSYILAKSKNKKPLPIILEHLSIAILVIIITYLLGEGISLLFN